MTNKSLAVKGHLKSFQHYFFPHNKSCKSLPEQPSKFKIKHSYEKPFLKKQSDFKKAPF